MIPSHYDKRRSVMSTEEVVDLMKVSRARRTQSKIIERNMASPRSSIGLKYPQRSAIIHRAAIESWESFSDHDVEEFFNDPDILGATELNNSLSNRKELNSINLYEAMCRKYKQRPSRLILKQLSKPALTVKHRSLGPHEIRPVAIALTINTSVSVLDIGGNNLGAEGVRLISQVISESIFITELDLSDNSIGGGGSLTLCEALLMNRWLRKLNLSGNNLADDDARYISKMLLKNIGISSLDISHNQIGSNGGSYLAVGIAKNEVLDSLDLSWNHIRLKGAEAMCAALKRNRSIRDLNLRFNGISGAGCMGLKAALPVNTTLKVLDISYNRIYETSFQLFISGLAKNVGIHTLKIGHNPLSTTCANSLLKVIKENAACELRDVDLTHVTVDQVFLENLAEINLSRFLRVVHDVSFHHDVTRAQHVDNMTLGDPMQHIISYVKSQNLRLIDVFRSFDVNGDNTLTRDEIIAGLESININVPRAALNDLVTRLDTDGDGEVDFGELLHGHKASKKALHRRLARRAAAALARQSSADRETESGSPGLQYDTEEEELNFLLEDLCSPATSSGARHSPSVGLPYTPTGKPIINRSQSMPMK